MFLKTKPPEFYHIKWFINFTQKPYENMAKVSLMENCCKLEIVSDILFQSLYVCFEAAFQLFLDPDLLTCLTNNTSNNVMTGLGRVALAQRGYRSYGQK